MDRRKDYAPPANWQDFEDLCLKLWRLKLVDAKKNGRTGQPQAGVDIFGRDPSTNTWIGIQCKQRGQWPRRSLKVGEIEAEVEQAEGFEPALSHFIIATTAPRDVEAQRFVRDLSDRRREESKFSVDLFAWDDLQDWLNEGPRASQQRQAAVVRGLVSFVETDAPIFYGRDTEINELAAMLQNPDFTIGTLHGKSGCGKTSLIRAGLIPRLQEMNFFPIYVRCRENSEPISYALTEAFAGMGLTQPPEPTALGQLSRTLFDLADRPIVLLCDQAEDLLLQIERSPSARSAFEALKLFAADTRLLFSVRSDAYYLIGRYFKEIVDHPLASSRTRELRRLREKQVREIVENAAELSFFPRDENFEDIFIEDLIKDGPVLPTELQIVSKQLQEMGIQNAREYHEAGGKEGLMALFLEGVLARSGQRDVATGVLSVFAQDSSLGRKLTRGEVRKEADVPRAIVDRVVDFLLRERMLQEIENGEHLELTHQYIIPKIREAAGLNEVKILRRNFQKKILKLIASVLVAFLILVLLTYRGDRVPTLLYEGHEGEVRSLLSIGDGLVVSGDDRGEVIFWDLGAKRVMSAIGLHDGPVGSIIVSPDGKVVASGSETGELVIGGFSEGLFSIRQRCYFDAGFADIDFSSDSKKIVATTLYSSVFLIPDVDNCDEYETLESDEGIDTTVAFSPGDEFFLTSGNDSWAADAKKLEFHLPGLGDGDFALNKKSGVLVNVDSGGFVTALDLSRVWSDPTLPPKVLISQKAHRTHGTSAAISSDSKWAATAAGDVLVWNLEDPSDGPFSVIYRSPPWAVAFLPSNRELLIGYQDGSIQSWSITSKSFKSDLTRHQESIGALSFSADGSRLASGDKSGAIMVWDTQLKRRVAATHQHSVGVVGLEFTEGGSVSNSTLLSLDQECSIYQLDPKDLTQELIYKDSNKRRCYALAVSPDGKYAAFSVGIVEIKKRDLVVDFQHSVFTEADRSRSQRSPSYAYIYGLDFTSPSALAIAEIPYYARRHDIRYEGSVRLLDVLSRQFLSSTDIRGREILSIKHIRDGRYILGTKEGALEIWEGAPLDRKVTVRDGLGAVNDIAVAENGSQVVSSGDAATLVRKDYSSTFYNFFRSGPVKIGADGPRVMAVALSPDGRLIATGGDDGSVRVYDQYRSALGIVLPY